MSIDDDVFLYPTQVKQLFQHLIAHPEIPHGYQGERPLPGLPAPSQANFLAVIANDASSARLSELYALNQALILMKLARAGTELFSGPAGDRRQLLTQASRRVLLFLTPAFGELDDRAELSLLNPSPPGARSNLKTPGGQRRHPANR